jgi:polyhydroxyalkanoate synthesis repressor PhaR
MDKKTPIVIKRYANRKLYNTNDSCYITLNEIAQMVKSDVDVKIIDHKSKKDITSVTLAQIIFEKEKRQRNLSSQTLKGIIRSGGGAITDFFQKRVNFGQIREEAERTVDAIEKVFTQNVMSRDDTAKMVRELVRHGYSGMEDLQRRIDERIKVIIGPVTSFGMLRKELDALRAQVDLLSEKLDGLAGLLGEAAEREGEPEVSPKPESQKTN